MKNYILIALLFFSCNSGNLTVIADLPTSLKEISAVETLPDSNLIWVIEDSGNDNYLYALNHNGDIEKQLQISNAQNTDWEDLTSDANGNIYIGDFGNNNKKRNMFSILKIEKPNNTTTQTEAQFITFSLPKKVKAQDFEAFFLMNDSFYVFSKNKKSGKLFKVPNRIGHHEALFITGFNLKGKNNPITSADISDDHKTIVLLNHDVAWQITNFVGDTFFEGTIKSLDFNHMSQKEGICFITNKSVYITDEKAKNEGGNLYEFNLK